MVLLSRLSVHNQRLGVGQLEATRANPGAEALSVSLRLLAP